MPTLQDVAKRAGVSSATVSKVLSNTPYFSEATREKVMEAVRELGYRPNLAARALSSGKTNIIAVVFPFIYDTIFKDPLVMRLLEGIEAVCTEQDYNLLLSTPRLVNNQPDEHYMRLIQSGYIEGLIAIDNIPAVSFAAPCEALNIPTVILGHHESDYRVQVDNFQGGKMLMEHILAEGHKNIGLITATPETNLAIEQRVEGMYGAYQAANIGFEMPVIESDFSLKGGAESARSLLQANPDLTAIIGLNDRMAIGAMNAVQEMGKSIPDDISVVGYDDIPLAATTQPGLTTINQKPVESGRVAAELLLKRLNGEKPSSTIISPELVIRGSVSSLP